MIMLMLYYLLVSLLITYGNDNDINNSIVNTNRKGTESVVKTRPATSVVDRQLLEG